MKRIFTLVASTLLAGAVTGCGRAIDAPKIENLIKEAIVKEGGTSLKSIICPKSQDNGKPLICTGILDSGSGFDIDVQLGEGDKPNWKIVSIKGLLNMMQVQGAIAEGLKKEVGEVTLDCQTTNYRSFKPGDSMECLLKKANGDIKPEGSAKPDEAKKNEAKKAGENDKADTAKTPNAKKPEPPQEPDKVLITMAPSGEVNWQRLTPAKPGTEIKSDNKSKPSDTNAAKPSDSKDSGTKDSKDTSIKDASAKPAPSEDKSKPMPPAAASANEAIAQPGALDNLED